VQQCTGATRPTCVLLVPGIPLRLADQDTTN
jgi:hypothetical protein